MGQIASQKESERKFGYNPGPQHGCNVLGRSINVYNFQCKGSKGGLLGDSPQSDQSIQVDEVPKPQIQPISRPVLYAPYRRPLLNFLLPVRRLRPITYADATRPIINRYQLPFRYQDQGSAVINVSGNPNRVQYVSPQNVYRPQSPQIAPVSSSNTDVYNPFRPESSTNVKPTPPSSNPSQSNIDNSYNPSSSSIDSSYNPFRPENSQNIRPTNTQTPSPLTVDYFGTPIPTYATTTTNRPNYAVPAYPANLPTIRPLSPSSISNYFTSTGSRPGLSQASAGISTIGNRPGYSQISASSGISSIGNRPGYGFTQVTSVNGGNSNQFGNLDNSSPNRPISTNDHRPITEDYDEDIDPPKYVSFFLRR